MTETEFRINHSRIIEYYQYIEMRLKVICAGLLSDKDNNWFTRLNDYESDPLGVLIKTINNIQCKIKTDLLTSEDLNALNDIRIVRNYWVHQCFGALEHVTFKNDMVRNQEYADRIMSDLEKAEAMDQLLADKVHSLDLSVDFIKTILKQYE